MTATKTTEYPFSDLPLLIDRGFHAGLVSGYAEVSYFADGDFAIEALYLDGYRNRTLDELEAALDAYKLNGGLMPPRQKWQYVGVERGSSIYQMIMDRLETDWRSSVQDHVNNAVERDYESAMEDYADHSIAEMRA